MGIVDMTPDELRSLADEATQEAAAVAEEFLRLEVA
jgi:hypothetical protein